MLFCHTILSVSLIILSLILSTMWYYPQCWDFFSSIEDNWLPGCESDEGFANLLSWGCEGYVTHGPENCTPSKFRSHIIDLNILNHSSSKALYLTYMRRWGLRSRECGSETRTRHIMSAGSHYSPPKTCFITTKACSPYWMTCVSWYAKNVVIFITSA